MTTGPGRWRTRARTLEAMVLLLLARLLVSGLAFHRWRWMLGTIVARPTTGGGATPADRALARSVDRAAWRLAGTCKCLPRAMALGWMMRRRNRTGQLVIAVLPGQARGTVDDPHAWFETGGEILIGDLGGNFVPLVRFAHAARHTH